MIFRKYVKCLSCEQDFILRITVGTSRKNKFRLNCPYCDFEIHGKLFLNYRNNDGSLNPMEKSYPEFRLTNANFINEFDPNKKYKYVSIFTDLPIISDYYICDNEENLISPSQQAMHYLRNDSIKLIQGLNQFYLLPENDFYLIKNAYLQYKKNDFNRAKEILNKISNEIPTDISRVPSVCARCHKFFFLGLLGPWPQLEEHSKLIEEIAEKNITIIFDVPQKIQELNVIKYLILEYFDMVNLIYDCKEIITFARYFDFVDLNNSPKYFISLDFPDIFFNLYEQLCEYVHNIIKIEVGYINLKERGSIDSFKTINNKIPFSNYKTYFNKAKLFNSLDLITESPVLGRDVNFAIDREIRNGIAHKKISFSKDGQEIIIRKDNKIITIPFDLALKKTIELCRIFLYGFGIISDQKRMISDELWNR